MFESAVPMTPIELVRAEWEASTAFCPRTWFAGKRRLLVTDNFRRYGEAIAVLEWSSYCVVSKLESLSPRGGAASRLIAYLKTLADSHRIVLFGNATAYVPETQTVLNGLLTQSELEAWYQRHGFVMHRNSLGIMEIWYPGAHYDARPLAAGDAAQAPRP